MKLQVFVDALLEFVHGNGKIRSSTITCRKVFAMIYFTDGSARPTGTQHYARAYMTLKFHEDSDIYCLACRIEFFIPILRTSCCVPVRNSDSFPAKKCRSHISKTLCTWRFTKDHRDEPFIIFSPLSVTFHRLSNWTRTHFHSGFIYLEMARIRIAE